jgi:hypothetical protein
VATAGGGEVAVAAPSGFRILFITRKVHSYPLQPQKRVAPGVSEHSCRAKMGNVPHERVHLEIDTEVVDDYRLLSLGICRAESRKYEGLTVVVVTDCLGLND